MKETEKGAVAADSSRNGSRSGYDGIRGRWRAYGETATEEDIRHLQDLRPDEGSRRRQGSVYCRQRLERTSSLTEVRIGVCYDNADTGAEYIDVQGNNILSI